MSKVIIAEKPSVAKHIAQALGISKRGDGFYEGKNSYITWAFGHLLELYDARDYDAALAQWRMASFPFIPNEFQYKVKSDPNNRLQPDSGAKKQLDTIRSLIANPDVDGIILATDYDREGQIIGDIILEYLQVEKPIKRLLLNEWTPTEVSEGLKRLVDNHTLAPLRDAGISRQWADWLIGINLTSVASLKYQRQRGKILNVGRVLMPTLKIIYDRDLEIENFIPEKYYRILIHHPFKSATIEAIFQWEGKERFEDEKWSLGLKEALGGSLLSSSRVEDVQRELKREYPPSLFNLSGLQGYVTSKYKGWSAEKVLKVAQNLYEKQLITYPRTSSIALEEALIQKAKRVLEVHKKGLPFEDQIEFHTGKRVFDASKVESHSAIIPTYIVPKGLAPDELAVYQAVKNRFLMQFMPVAEHEETRITIHYRALDETQYHAGRGIAKGRVQIVEGWRLIEAVKSKEKALPLLEVDTLLDIKKVVLEAKGTKPPKAHTEKSLLRVMETCGKRKAPLDEGDDHDEDDDSENDATSEHSQVEIEAILSGYSIGTPATRAETIAKLLRVGYITRKGKQLICTPMGRRMVEQFPVKSLFDLEYTGRLEKSLSDIHKCHLTKQDFMERIVAFTTTSVEAIKGDDFKLIGDEDQLREEDPDRRSLGACLNCGAPVYNYEKFYGCSNYRGGCKFSIWKDDRFLAALKVVPTEQTIKKLLENGKVCSHQFVNKKGETFSACLTYRKKTDSDFFQWHFT